MTSPAKPITPPQREGVEKNFEHTVAFGHLEAAKERYRVAKGRLLDIHRWEEIARPGSSRFSLTDANGYDVSRHPQVGDHIKIDLPTPGHQFDWVRIVSIEEEDSEDQMTQSIGIKVHPAPNPLTKEKHVSHFFSSRSSSSFIVQREGVNVIAKIEGRNEQPNSQSNSWWQKVKNWVIALFAMAGVANIQWQNLVRGLLKEK